MEQLSKIDSFHSKEYVDNNAVRKINSIPFKFYTYSAH